MTPSELIEAIEIAISSELSPEERLPIHIWGEPGVGKSDIVRQVARALKIKFIDLRAVLLDPVDLRGLPRVDGVSTRWLPPAFLPTEGEGILFLDELTSAPQMVQAACYQLTLDRRLGEYCLPPGWMILAAGNPASSRGVHFSMPEPLKNRFEHLYLQPNLEEWCNWAIGRRVPSQVVSFLRFRPELLLEESSVRLKRSKDEKDNGWASPRSWDMLGRLLRSWQKRYPDGKRPKGNQLLLEMAEGIVGKGAASEFYTFLEVVEKLPTIADILEHPDTTKVPSGPDACIAIATALGSQVTAKNIASAVTYLTRMRDKEYTVIAMRDAVIRDREIAKTKTFMNFAIEHPDLAA